MLDDILDVAPVIAGKNLHIVSITINARKKRKKKKKKKKKEKKGTIRCGGVFHYSTELSVVGYFIIQRN